MITRLFLFSIAFLCISSIALAQRNDPPDGQFGVGIVVQGSNGFGDQGPGGLSGTYAIDRHMQVGAELALGIQSGGGASTTQFGLAPFFRYLFSSKVSPFVQGGFAVYSNGGTGFNLSFGGGLAYYLSHTFGIIGAMDILDIQLSPGTGVQFGWVTSQVGISWFFNAAS